MSVLIEAVSVVVRREAISRKYQGGWKAFISEVPNVSTLCADRDLAALSFWEPEDATFCIDLLVAKGVAYLEGGWPVDLEIVDQTQGLKNQAPWCRVFEFWLHGNPEQCVTACETVGSTEEKIFLPAGWVYEGSLSQHCLYFNTTDRDKCVHYLRHEDGRDVYDSPLLEGDEVIYVKRSF